MRQVLLVLVLACGLASSTGCMVLDEIDNASAKMPSTNKKKAADTSETASASPVDDRKQQLIQQSKVWWETATSLSSESADTSIVRCRLDGGSQFMSRDDCLTRGGRVSGG